MGKPRALKNKDVVPSVKIDLSTRVRKISETSTTEHFGYHHVSFIEQETY